VTYLKTQAIAHRARGCPNIQASWVTMGMKVGQVALRFGANDFGSLMMEENVVSARARRTAHAERDATADRRCGLHTQKRKQDYTILEDRGLKWPMS